MPTAAAKAFIAWRYGLLADLSGDGIVSAQEMVPVEMAIWTRLYAEHLVQGAVQLVDSLARILGSWA